MAQFVLILAFIWGLFWAGMLQHHPLGRFLARRRTWLTVVIGVGVDLLLLYVVLALEEWLLVVAVLGLSSVGIIGRSLWNEQREIERQIDVAGELAGGGAADSPPAPGE
jgi:hypothetical protein